MNARIEPAFETAEGAFAFVVEHIQSFCALAAKPDERWKLYLFADSLRHRPVDYTDLEKGLTAACYWHFTAGLLEKLVEEMVARQQEATNG